MYMFFAIILMWYCCQIGRDILAILRKSDSDNDGVGLRVNVLLLRPHTYWQIRESIMLLWGVQGTLHNGHPSVADTHDITNNSESPDHFSIDARNL